jgi:hypothetical protein
MEVVMRLIPIVLLAILPAAATAQQRSAPSTPQSHDPSVTNRLEAPIGHRQPRMSDLPPEVVQKEQSGRPAEQGRTSVSVNKTDRTKAPSMTKDLGSAEAANQQSHSASDCREDRLASAYAVIS